METKLKSMFVAALTLAASTQKLGINLSVWQFLLFSFGSVG